MMEGVGSEAASLAGHLALDDLCWIYDNNHITIEGNTKHHLYRRCRRALPRLPVECAAGRRCQRPRAHRGRARDLSARRKGRPTLIILNSHIGYGSPHKADTSAAHGEPLGEEEVQLTKRAYGWPEDAKFLVPDGVYEHFAAGIGAARRRGATQTGRRCSPTIVRSFPISPPRSTRCSGANCRRDGTATCRVFPADAKGIAGRDASGKVLNVLAQNIPVVPGRFGRSRPVEQDHADIRRRRRL